MLPPCGSAPQMLQLYQLNIFTCFLIFSFEPPIGSEKGSRHVPAYAEANAFTRCHVSMFELLTPTANAEGTRLHAIAKNFKFLQVKSVRMVHIDFHAKVHRMCTYPHILHNCVGCTTDVKS